MVPDSAVSVGRSVLVQDFLERSAERLPDKLALVCSGQRLTYTQVDQMADRLANALIAHGVRRGDRVGIYLSNTVGAVVGIFAVVKAGAVFVLINRATKLAKLTFILNNCRAVALLTDDRAAAQNVPTRLGAAVPSLEAILLPADLSLIYDTCPATRPPRVNVDLDLACLVYTSGTTGEPKGVMSEHGSVVFAAGSVGEYLRAAESDVVLNVLPLSYSYGLYQVLITFERGGTLVLEKSFAYPIEILETIERERVTALPGVPTMFATLVGMDLTPYDLSSLRYATNAAAALPIGNITDLRRKLPHVTLYSMYGLTETKRALYLPPEWLERKPASVGIAIPGTEVWLEDEAGNRLGPGEIGELVVRGPHVMRGYWEAPEATAARFRPGAGPGERVCYTGDLFRTDEDGCMYFVARKDDIIKSRGEKVAPREIEAVLSRLPGVLEAAVVGVPDAVLGQAIKAVLVVSGTVTAADVLHHCRRHLEDFMVPNFVEFRTKLPRTSTGKVRTIELAQGPSCAESPAF
jgi:long-chain acyl-CoA synthetase